MKNRIAKSLLYSLCALLLFAGCGKQEKPAEEEQKTESSTAAEDPQPEQPEETGEGEEPQTQPEELEPLVLVGNQRIISISPSGEVEMLYEKQEKEYLLQAVMGDGVLYAVIAEDEDNAENCLICAIRDGEKELIAEIPNYNINIEYYEGSLFVQHAIYDDEGGYTVYLDDYTRGKDASYEKGNRFQELRNSLEGQDYHFSFHNPNNLITSLKRYDEILVYTSDGKIAALDKQGNQLWETTLLQEYYLVEAVNTEYTLYSVNTEENGEYWKYTIDLVLHNNQTGEEKTLFTWNYQTPEEAVSPLAVEGDKLYYYRTFSENGLNQNDIYSYDLVTGGTEFLYTAATLPGPGGTWQINPGVTDFNCYDGKFYYRAISENSTGWAVYDPKTGTGQGDMLPVIDEERTFAKYGKVLYEGGSIRDEEWDLEIYTYYIECFQLEDSYQNADKINQVLEQEQQEALDTVQQSAENEKGYITEEDAQDERFTPYPYSYDMSLGQVNMLGSHYLTVNYDGYEYWGGAHGYPYRQHYLFDLNTGEELTIYDLYTSTEENFKDVVAKYSVQNWKENPEIYFNSEEEEETVYQDFYDNASLDMAMRFEKQGIVIEYSPYEYGPYAVGFIEIPIPYDVLGIELD